MLESIITPTTVHDAHTNKNFTDVQTLFLDGEAVFMVNGSWLMNESTGTKTNFGMMKMPVISSIVEKLEDTAMDDATLSATISEVDEGKRAAIYAVRTILIALKRRETCFITTLRNNTCSFRITR